MHAVTYVVIVGLVVGCSGCPDTCSCLANVAHCEGRQLEAIPNDIPSVTTQLLLQRNNLSTLNFNNLNLENLQVLDLRFNNIVFFSSQNLNGLPLRVLKLDYNSINRNVFEVAVLQSVEDTLTNLSISHNNFSSRIDQSMFRYLEELIDLNLSNNSFTFIQAEAFPRKLLRLDLSNNQFTSFNSHAFGALRSLRYLDLRGLRMTLIKDYLFQDMRSLVHLRVSGPKLLQVNVNFLNGLSSVTTLEIAGSSISDFPLRFLQYTQRLENLDLSNNQLNTLTAEFFSFVPSLKNLILKGNNFNNIEALVSVLSSVRLISLNLDSNELQGSFASITAEQRQLEMLSVAQNNFEDIDYDVDSTSLSKLNLAYNNIFSISHDAFFNVPSLQSINLTGNMLASLPDFRTNNTVVVILRENPWHCTCDFYYAFVALRSGHFSRNLALKCSNESDDHQCLTCNSPQLYVGSYVGTLRDACCSPGECSTDNGFTAVNSASSMVGSTAELVRSTSLALSSTPFGLDSTHLTVTPLVAQNSGSMVVYIVIPIVILVVIAAVAFYWIKRKGFTKNLNIQNNNINLLPEANEGHHIYESVVTEQNEVHFDGENDVVGLPQQCNGDNSKAIAIENAKDGLVAYSVPRPVHDYVNNFPQHQDYAVADDTAPYSMAKLVENNVEPPYAFAAEETSTSFKNPSLGRIDRAIENEYLVPTRLCKISPNPQGASDTQESMEIPNMSKSACNTFNTTVESQNPYVDMK